MTPAASMAASRRAESAPSQARPRPAGTATGRGAPVSTCIAPFGAFVELEPGIEGLAHASTFAPTGASGGWSASLTPGMTGAFEILSIEPEKKRIGVALVEEGSSRSRAAVNAGGAAQEAPDDRDDTAREDAAKAQSFGSLADKLRGALAPREK